MLPNLWLCARSVGTWLVFKNGTAFSTLNYISNKLDTLQYCDFQSTMEC